MRARIHWSLALLLVLPLAARAETLALVGGTVHPVSGPAFVGTLIVSDGRIVALGEQVELPPDAKPVVCAGLELYPGFTDAFGQVGLLEVSSVSATDDRSEMGAYNPHLAAATAIHPASDLIAVTRSTGITQALVAPRGGRDGVIAGRAALVHLAGWTVEEMAIDASAALVVSWPEIRTRSFDFATFTMKESAFEEAKKEAKKQQDELRDWLDAARHYRQATGAKVVRVTPDPRLAHLAAYLDRGGKVLVQANAKRDIEAALDFARAESLDLVIVGGRDAWQLTEKLAEAEVPVILGSTQTLPSEEDEPYDRPVDGPARLVAAGVKIAFGSGGGPHGARELPFEVAQAVAGGLSEEDALKALTIWPAEILGVADQLGTLEPGKRANLAIVQGDPISLDSTVRQLVIDGRLVSPRDFHLDLYERYRSRPRP